MEGAQFHFARLIASKLHKITLLQKFSQAFFLVREQEVRVLKLLQKFLGRSFRRVEIEALFEIKANRVWPPLCKMVLAWQAGARASWQLATSPGHVLATAADDRHAVAAARESIKSNRRGSQHVTTSNAIPTQIQSHGLGITTDGLMSRKVIGTRRLQLKKRWSCRQQQRISVLSSS